MTGSVVDQYAVVPQSRGKFKIPSVGFSYFNPKEEKYYSVESEPILLNALQGPEPVEEGVVTNKKSVISNEGDIRYIHLKSDFVSVVKEDDFFKSNLFYWLMILPLLSIPLGIYIGKKKQERDSDIIGNKRRKADRLARRYLSQAKKELGRKEAFYIALEKALHNYLKAKLQVETSEISREKIAEILKDRKVDQDTINEFSKVLENCDYARYTPSTDVMMKKEYENAKTVISKIDKQL